MTISEHDTLNSRLAWLLGAGTWISCGLIATGMMLSAAGSVSPHKAVDFISAGIVLLIALPALRVAVMAVSFLRSHEVDFALVAASVFAIILFSTLLGAGVF